MNERQEAYCQNRMKGISKQRSAVLAGYADVDKAGDQVEESQDVRVRLAELQRETAESAGVTKEMVIQGFLDAAATAKVQADATGMVAAWRETGKLLGYYAPEVKKIEKGISKSDMKKALEELSDDELLKLAKGRVYEGEYRRIPEKEVPALPKLSS